MGRNAGERGQPADYGAVGDGVADDTTAVQAWVHATYAFVSSTATDGTSTTLVDTTQTFTPYTLSGCYVYIYSGTGKSTTKTAITGQSPTSITVASWPAGTPNATSKYLIFQPHTESRSCIRAGFAPPGYYKLTAPIEFWSLTGFRGFGLGCGSEEGGHAGGNTRGFPLPRNLTRFVGVGNIATIFDFNGAKRGVCGDFTIEGGGDQIGPTSGPTSLIRYRNDETINQTSSRCAFYNVLATGVWKAAAWEMGATNNQEDMVSYHNCAAEGSWDYNYGNAQDTANKRPTGISTGSNTSTAFKDTTKNWQTNIFSGGLLLLGKGTGADGEIAGYTVDSNTATQLTINRGTPLPTTDATTTYRVLTVTQLTYWQAGFITSSAAGVNGNNLLHHFFGVTATHCRFGIQAYTDTHVHSGNVQSNWVDLYNGGSAISKFQGIRSEGSSQLFRGLGAQASVELDDIEWRIDDEPAINFHHVNTGGVVVQWTGNQTLVMNNVHFRGQSLENSTLSRQLQILVGGAGFCYLHATDISAYGGTVAGTSRYINELIRIAPEQYGRAYVNGYAALDKDGTADLTRSIMGEVWLGGPSTDPIYPVMLWGLLSHFNTAAPGAPDISLQRKAADELECGGGDGLISGARLVSAAIALTYGTTVNTDAKQGNSFEIVATNGTAFTIANPTNTKAGQQLEYEILNSSGGAMGAITWGAEFMLAGAFANPANGKRRTITFRRNSANTRWVERNRAAADI